LETTDAGADSKYRRIGAGYREAFGNVDRDAGKPQLSRLGVVQAQCFKDGTAGEPP